MKEILFVGQSFQFGGISKALINTANALLKTEDCNITIYSFGKGPLAAEIDPRIKVVYGNRRLNVISTPFKDVLQSKNLIDIVLRIFMILEVRILGSEKFYRKLFRSDNKKFDCDIAISYFHDNPGCYFYQGTNQFVDEFIDGAYKIGWLHTDPIKACFHKEECEYKYRNFDRIACVSYENKHSLDKLAPLLKDKTRVVYNLTPISEIKKRSLEYKPFVIKDSKIILVSVGRIDNVSKRYNLIPEVVKILIQKGHTNFKWFVIGDGPDFANNLAVVKENGLEGFISYEGAKTNPYPYILNSDLLVITSAYEGYPMVIGEAFALGKPICTTAFGAVNELIVPEKNGLITGFSANDIAEVLDRLLSEKHRLEEMKRYINDNPITNERGIVHLINLINGA